MGRQKHIQVLRIEDSYGRGIFRNGFAFNYCRELSMRHQDFHTPQEDGLDLYKADTEWFCSYKSIEQIQKWIKPEEFKVMEKHGFRVYLLTITKYQTGEHQVIFPKECIKDKKDIMELFI